MKKIQVVKVEGGEDFVDHGYAIIYHQSLNEFFEFFENLIKKKSEAYVKLPNDWEFVCLIASDEEQYLKTIKMEVGKFYGFLKQFSLFDSIIKSNFHEITLLAGFSTGFFHLPLNWLIFLNEFHVFSKFWNDSITIKSLEKTHMNMVSNFLICLLNLGFKNIFLGSDNGLRVIVIGNRFWKINIDTGEIKEHSFLAIEVSKLLKAEDIYKNYLEFQDLFSKYKKFSMIIRHSASKAKINQENGG